MKTSNDISTKWLVKEDGMKVLSTSNKTHEFYISTDGVTSYRLDGKVVSFKRLP